MHGTGRQPYSGSPSLKFNSRKLTVLQLKRNITVRLINVDKLLSQPNLDQTSLDFTETSFIVEYIDWIERFVAFIQVLAVLSVKIYNAIRGRSHNKECDLNEEKVCTVFPKKKCSLLKNIVLPPYFKNVMSYVGLFLFLD
ncbi:unnamed protein product [Heterotrigona itama]|uniref:Uncharacterized protein n=1 Tax=Heterotrigona itama TaxID=395501 RepID=A0A6V7GTZ4_9HYME|nr:unnamed protein product [Heterotrigona itama]